MRQTSKIVVALLVTLPAACMTGPSTENFRPVTHATGVELIVSGKKAAVRGELLEVRENELVVLERRPKKADREGDCAVVVVAFRQVRNTIFKGGSPSWDRGVPTEAERAELRLLSRFPMGITPPIMEQLLSCSTRAKPAVVTL